MFLAVRPHCAHSQAWRFIFKVTRWTRDITQSKALSGMEEQGINYKEWGQEKLIERVTLLEKQLRELNERYLDLSWPLV